MNNNGLTQSEIKRFDDLIIKANSIQLLYLSRVLEVRIKERNEIKNR